MRIVREPAGANPLRSVRARGIHEPPAVCIVEVRRTAPREARTGQNGQALVVLVHIHGLAVHHAKIGRQRSIARRRIAVRVSTVLGNGGFAVHRLHARVARATSARIVAVARVACSPT